MVTRGMFVILRLLHLPEYTSGIGGLDMTTACLADGTPIFLTPSVDDVEFCRESGRKLQGIENPADADIEVRIRHDNETEQTIPIPLSALQLLTHILDQLAQGNSISLTPMHAELTTTEAARVLKVSRPFLIGLLEKGEIPFRKIGTHRRILYRDLMTFKQKNEEDRLKVLEELSALDQEYGLR
jgi:excisionase family DNA binding protein